ncbi:pyridoxamine 5'-phosphate oxidase family protein [Mariniflexile gromovii]|uniref:Pyridoxamine 5'-phosphate oxidase family protein n=1 Tax=Mariniflexile gromovii TaxID=362523 RepID=A0ABS4BR01_9FLAO|nr:pyridoxamine 5'-phosphate oxidase family protein [Mariniflexile gromovii]MBP0902947.1 pyridoxamine 5'-phosphate oxidase family protein [Mariniflexile gromovii]
MIANLNKTECLKILSRNYIGHLAYIYKNLPFVIPITYYYDQKNVTVIGYSGEGHKTKALRLNNAVALEVSEITTINNWQSVLIHGTFEELDGTNAKSQLHEFSQGVKKLVSAKEKRDVNFINEFSGKVNFEAVPIVYNIKIEEITGKQREPKLRIER